MKKLRVESQRSFATFDHRRSSLNFFMTQVQLSEKLLLEAGGWQAMKQARALRGMGRVVSASYSPPMLKGLVREGDKEFRAGLKIAGASDIENICTCQQSRGWGTICAHSLAVGLE